MTNDTFLSARQGRAKIELDFSRQLGFGLCLLLFLEMSRSAGHV